MWEGDEEVPGRGTDGGDSVGVPRLDNSGWIVDTDALGHALGAVLMQVQDGLESHSLC